MNFRFRFSAEGSALLSVAHTFSAECVTSLSAYFRFRPKVKFPLSVDLYKILLKLIKHFICCRLDACSFYLRATYSVGLAEAKWFKTFLACSSFRP